MPLRAAISRMLNVGAASETLTGSPYTRSLESSRRLVWTRVQRARTRGAPRPVHYAAMPASTTATTNLPPEDASHTLTIAVTGAGGTVGPSLLARLAESDRVGRIVLLGRHRT